MKPAVKNGPSSYWVQSPTVDLTFFTLGWIVALAAFLIMDQTEVKNQSRNIILISILLFSFLHRHLTFPLVYGDPQEFRLRKKSYLIYPVLFLALTLAGIFYVRSPVVITKPLPEQVQLRPGSMQTINVYQNKKSRGYQVRFSGRETTPEQVAQRFQKELQGVMSIQAIDGRLHFRMNNPDANSSFYFAARRGGRGLSQQLGIQGMGGKRYYSSRPLLLALIVLTVLWNIYHTVMQKIGLLRVYARKANYGRPRVDKALLFSWLVLFMLILAGSPEARARATSLSQGGRVLDQFFSRIEWLIPYLTAAALLVCAYVTYLYLAEEFRHRRSFSWPKNLFVISILALFAGFAYDFLVGYAVFGFSHAIEYLAFVYFFCGKKYAKRDPKSSFMARAVAHQRRSMLTYCLILMGLFLTWRYFDAAALGLYILGSSFLHFLYDGWIWKVRKPEVGQPLGIQYQPAKVRLSA